jgi:hypothetical protein
MDSSTLAAHTMKEIYYSKHGEAPKLTITNYHAWSRAMRYILLAANAWDIVENNEGLPKAPAACADVNKSCSAVVQTFILGYPTPH